MEQSLQARLIGATVLVTLAVLLIPELLSGRKTVEPPVEDGAAAKGTRSFTIELGSPGGQVSMPGARAPAATAPATVPPAAPSDPPATAAGAAVEVPDVESPQIEPAGPSAQSPPEAQPPAPEPPATTASTAPTPPAEPVKAGGWVVQVGAFGSADAARRLVDELSAAGFEAHVAPVTRSGRTLHRVRVGPVAGRPAADQLAVRLKGRGLPAAVVAND
jgi:DedD protein